MITHTGCLGVWALTVGNTKNCGTAKNNQKFTVLHSSVNPLSASQTYDDRKYDDRLGDGLTAYRKQNSCETSLIDRVEDWKFARDNRLLV